ncbi:MAG TPA: NAD(P)H-dependent glycerol-3-phosphate dehydrogenase [Abditibacteriaceae bacterium]|nr:NAD(P)H-dependent glycerol-3-phosphate dehydrogenase [Abditibacteriaceae bacterium]
MSDSSRQAESTGSPGTETVVVLGAGSWGTALAHLISAKGAPTRLWARSREAAGLLTQAEENVKYLPGVSLANVAVSADLADVLMGAQWVVAALPCAVVSELASTLRDALPPQAVVISGTKGLDPESGLRPSQIWERHSQLPAMRYVALSGPNLAKEIAAGVPTSTVVASENPAVAGAAQQLLSTPAFRVYTNADLIGVELGGALKNVVAIAAGISDGLGFGDNSKAAIITRAWREMTRLAVTLGARETTLFGLSGIGDLFATCASPHSRNHSLGYLLARGETLSEAQHEVAQVAEGVHTTRAALHLARAVGVELPITEQVAAILFAGRDPRQAVTELMSRQGCSE